MRNSNCATLKKISLNAQRKLSNYAICAQYAQTPSSAKMSFLPSNLQNSLGSGDSTPRSPWPPAARGLRPQTQPPGSHLLIFMDPPMLQTKTKIVSLTENLIFKSNHTLVLGKRNCTCISELYSSTLL